MLYQCMHILCFYTEANVFLLMLTDKVIQTAYLKNVFACSFLFLLGAVRRPSQGIASVFCFYLWFSCPKFPARLQSPNSDWAWVLKWKFVAPQFLAGVRMEFEDIDQEGWILMFFGFFLLINSSSRLTLYRHIVAVRATIDMQSPHAKLLCLNISNEVEISPFWSWQKI